MGLEYFIPDQGFADNHPDFHHESMARLTIRDNGCGMPESVLAKIFDPFFTTCKLIVETLDSLNYRTLCATDGVEALRLFDHTKVR